MRWWLIVSGMVIAAGILTVFVPVDRPAAVEAAKVEPAPVRVWHEERRAETPPAPQQAERATAVASQPERQPREVAGQRSAAERAGQIVERALSRRELSPEDVIALRQLGPQLGRSEQDELRMRMIRALNRQELRLDPRAGLP